MTNFCSEDVRRLLHNKYVVVLGDSIQRSVYKDLVKLLRTDQYLTEAQLKRKGELTFENDSLVEGGQLKEMHNGTDYQEVRQYSSDHHLVRFYFLTRAYSAYLESVLSDFQEGPQPDVLIINSCFWDLTRYFCTQMEDYKANLEKLFRRLNVVLSPECLVLWNMTMPVGYKDNEMPENLKYNVRWYVVEGNYFSASLANSYKMDVLDMHYHFRFDLQRRCRDAIHWDQLAHRKYTLILLTHIARAWGVELPPRKNHAVNLTWNFTSGFTWLIGSPLKPECVCSAGSAGGSACLPDQGGNGAELSHPLAMPCQGYSDFSADCNNFNNDHHFQQDMFCPGYTSFDDGFQSNCDSPGFYSDSPVTYDGVKPGYLSFDGNMCNGKGPPGNGNPFSTMQMTMSFVPHLRFPNMNFPSFSPYGPYHPEGFRNHHGPAMRRPYRPENGWNHPYHRPHLPPARIY
ncbi:PC-esterase domain-containing protein 1A-like [Pelodytes ibericus]